MSKRVRYDGPFEEVNVGWPPGQVPAEQTWTVKNNHLLPDDIPAALRDELAAREDFTEVDQSTSSKKKED